LPVFLRSLAIRGKALKASHPAAAQGLNYASEFPLFPGATSNAAGARGAKQIGKDVAKVCSSPATSLSS
jgi:hypothetical protein